MRAKQNLHRRKFLRMGLAATAGGTLASCTRTNGPYWRFFTPQEARTVEAICGQIIPADRDPGATEAGAVHYIDLQLTRHFKSSQGAYRQGIASVDTISRSSFGRRFVELSFAEQTEVLAAVEKNARPFFDLVLAHTMQGFYGDPRHGGNRNEVSWKMIGVPFPPVRGRSHDDDQKVG